MTTHNAYDHEAVIHGFVKKCLRFFYTEVDIEEGEYQELENDLPEYAETIINGGGYDLDKRIAALETQLRAESAENRRLREALFKSTKDLKRMVKTAYALEAYVDALWRCPERD